VYDFDIVSIKWAGLEHIFTDKKDRESASPIRHISKNTPQFLLFYAENDYFTLDSQAIDMHNCLRTNGVRSVLWQVPKRDHETILFDICDPDSKTSKNIIGFVK
jgi:dipeptidyl aminopeptidase/acylaminoacyl peptidase